MAALRSKAAGLRAASLDGRQPPGNLSFMFLQFFTSLRDAQVR